VQTADHRPPGAPGAPAAPAGRPALGRYRLLRRLGTGGFGCVFLAHDERLDRMVAVKRIVLADAATAARAEREARAAARLGHPGIVALFEAGRDDEAVYLVSELVRGRSLADLEEDGLLCDRDVVAAGLALCDALDHAHRRGVVHRDVKPANVIVADGGDGEPASGAVKLTDFGIAQIAGDEALTATGDVVGTLAYMAPEQADGRPVDARTDLYALGLVLFEALAGWNPVRGNGAADTARRVGSRLPPLARARRDLPAGLCAAVDAAVRARPEERGTLGELRAALAAALPVVGDDVGTVAPAGPRRRRFRRRPASDADDADRTQEWDRAPLVRAPPAAGGRDGPRSERGAAEERFAGSGGPAAQEPASPWSRPAAPASTAGRGARGRSRLAAGLAAGALAGAALAWLGPAPPVAPLAGAVAAALAVALLPFLGWLAAAAALAGWLAADAPGLAALVAAAALPAAILVRRGGVLLSAPALAPLLGLAALAPAWPAIAGQVAGPVRRVALGLLGCWWLVLAELASGERLLLGPPPGAAPPEAWRDSAVAALSDAVWPAVTSGALLAGAAWAAAALVLPLLVPGRAFALDVAGAAAWAAGTGAAVQALARTLSWDGAAPDVRGLVAGSLLAGVIAVGARAARAGEDARRPRGAT
jgi:hypothetical protein